MLNKIRVSGYVAQLSNQLSILKGIVKSIKEGKYTDSIKASKTVLVGHSYGSRLSNALIANDPDIVDGMPPQGFYYNPY